MTISSPILIAFSHSFISYKVLSIEFKTHSSKVTLHLNFMTHSLKLYSSSYAMRHFNSVMPSIVLCPLLDASTLILYFGLPYYSIIFEPYFIRSTFFASAPSKTIFSRGVFHPESSHVSSAMCAPSPHVSHIVLSSRVFPPVWFLHLALGQ